METIIDLFEKSVSRFPENIFLMENKTGKYEGITYKKVRQEVFLFSAGLQSIGIKKGDRIGLISEGRNQWLIAELGILYAGAVNVPLSVKLDAETELKFRLEHSGCRMIIVSEGQSGKINKNREKFSSIENVIYLDDQKKSNENDLLFEEVKEKGKIFLGNNQDIHKQRYQSVGPDDLANISYTSGTTSDPKGIMLTHMNYVSNVIQANTLMDIKESWRTLTLLPWDHAFAHTACLYCFMINGATVASLQNGKTPMQTLRNIPKNIKEVKPDMMMSVPALAKSFRKNIESGIRQKGKTTEKLFRNALKVAYAYNRSGFDKGKGLSFLYKPLVSFYDKILFSKIRQTFGGNLKLFIGGGALLDTELQRFFYAIGIPMCQGYGLSESAPVISSNTINHIKFGSSGKLVKYLGLKITDNKGIELPTGQQGEILVKGKNIMKGYWKNPKATEETVIDGWLHTGDMGYMDKDGFLYVLGRFKSLLIGNDGEKYSPEGIEESILHSPFIEQCMLYNNQNAYTIALIVPNISAINAKLNQNKKSSDYLKIIQKEIHQHKKGGTLEGLFPERWLPSAIVILPERFTEKNHLLNSTMKVVRRKVAQRFKKEIDFAYTPEAKNIVNSLNKESINKLKKEE